MIMLIKRAGRVEELTGEYQILSISFKLSIIKKPPGQRWFLCKQTWCGYSNKT